MKTSVNMIRKMDKFDVIQRTKDGYFDANVLLNQWNKENKLNSNRIRIDKFLSFDKTIAFIEEIESHREIEPYGDNQAFIIKKGRNTKNGRTKDEVWMHPYLFIDFAMWINPKFKYHVIKFVYDQLIQFRHDAGDMLVGLRQAMSRHIPNPDYALITKALHYVVCNDSFAGIRQTMTQQQLKELSEVETNIAFSINMGYLKTTSEIRAVLVKLYKDKYRIKF